MSRFFNLTHSLGGGRPPAPLLWAPLVDAQVGPEAAQHLLQVLPLSVEPDPLLGHSAGLSAQKPLHLSHTPHVLSGHGHARTRTALTETGGGERGAIWPLTEGRQLEKTRDVLEWKKNGSEAVLVW